MSVDDYAAAHGLTPLARIVSWASVGRRARADRAGADVAIPKALDRAGLTVDDIDLFEINEAFCSVPVAATAPSASTPTIVNVNGSGCSLGHPIAATGARMVVTMIHELRRRGGSTGVRVDVRRRRHGLGHGPRAALAPRTAGHAAPEAGSDRVRKPHELSHLGVVRGRQARFMSLPWATRA